MDVNAGRVLNAGDFDIVRDGRRNRTEGQQEKREEGKDGEGRTEETQGT